MWNTSLMNVNLNSFRIYISSRWFQHLSKNSLNWTSSPSRGWKFQKKHVQHCSTTTYLWTCEMFLQKTKWTPASPPPQHLVRRLLLWVASLKTQKHILTHWRAAFFFKRGMKTEAVFNSNPAGLWGRFILGRGLF